MSSRAVLKSEPPRVSRFRSVPPAPGAKRRGMKIGIPKENRPGERRVAATPDTVSRLLKLGFEVSVESQAGAGASFRDAEYAALGASVLHTARELWDTSDIILKVQPPEQNLELGTHEAELLREGGTLVSFIWPGKNG